MNIYDALSKDHRTFERQLDALIEASKQKDERWKDILDELRTGLIAHSRAEESVLYNALRAEEVGEPLVAHAYGEHATAEVAIRTLGLAKLIDTTWVSLAEKLSHDLRHHIEEEESKIYATARKVLSDEEANQIGAAFLRMKKLMTPDGDSVLASNIDLIANLLPPRLSARFREAEAAQTKKASARDAAHP